MPPNPVMQVIIIDDAATSRQILRRLLEDIPGVACQEFGDPRDALEWCALAEPDLMVVDYQLPGINGLEFLAEVRSLPGRRRCPVIFVTADATKDLRHAALQRGAADFLNKPIDPAEFAARACNLLEIRAEQQLLKTRLQRHLDRLEALWRLAARTDLTGDELLVEMLEEAAVALNPADQYFGVVCEIESDYVVAKVKGEKAWVRTGRRPDLHPFPSGLPVPTNSSLSSLLPVDGRARWWIDLSNDPQARNLIHHETGLRAAIGARFFVELKTYTLIFFSYAEPTLPFDQSDATYVELLASFFGSKLREIEHAEVIRFQAYHDPLTGLLNRTGIKAHLKEAVGAHETAGNTLAVSVVDIDQFKEINDTLGSDTGDFVLKVVAGRLGDAVRPGDTIARIGANSFVLSFKNLHAAEQAEEMTRRVIAAISAPIAADESLIRLTASAGIALFPNDARTADELIARADAALDLAKQHGRDRIEFSSPDIEERLRWRQALRQSLLRGLGANEFELYLQPEIDLTTGRPICAEALVRWNHPDGRLAPSDFIPFAEENGLIRPLSLYIMRHAMMDAEYLAGLIPDFRLFFNLSAHDLANPDFLDEFSKALREYSVDPRNLGVEVTESSAMTNVAKTVAVLGALKDKGITIALDDFGTGHSSLAILRHLPIDVIKVDRNFVTGIPEDTANVAITRNIINFGHDLGKIILVEGIETRDQYRWLREHGCDRGQGFYLGEPMTRDALVEWLGRRVA